MAKKYSVKIDLPDGRKVEISATTQKQLIEKALAKYGSGKPTESTVPNIKTIQAIAGHSDIQTTMNRYVHKDVSQIQLAGREFGEKVTEILTKTNTSKPLQNNGLDA